MEPARPDLFQYNNYRLFLRDIYHHLKTKEKKYSHRFIARQVNASSCGWFSDVIKGRINLTPKFLLKLVKLFKFTESEADYFRSLVDYDQAGSFEEKEILYKKIIGSTRKIKTTIVYKDQFALFSKWYICAVRELLLIFDFNDDYQTLGKKLSPPISAKQAKEAIDVLVSCRLIEKNGLGYYKPKDFALEKDSTFASFYWTLYMNAFLDLAKESIERYKKDERDVSAVSVTLSAEGYKKACDVIRDMRKKLVKIAQDDARQEIVYQCNVQLFPLTQK